MADAINEDLLDEALLGADPEGGEGQSEPPEPGDEDEVLISFDGEGDAPPQGEGHDSGLVRNLREQLRDRDRQLKAFQAQSQPQKIEVGEKPTLARCDYDEERYETELDAWKERDSRAKAQEQDAAKVQEARQADWQKRLAAVEVQKTELGVKDYDQAADEVRTTFSTDQQSMIVRATKNPARMIYALGKSPSKAADLAKISDPIDFIAEIARLERSTSVTTNRRSAPAPEQVARGSARIVNGPDQQEKRLEAEAARTGNYTKLFEYRRTKRQQGKS